MTGRRKRVSCAISTREADLPAIGFVAHRYRFDRALHATGPAHSNTPDLGPNEIPLIPSSAMANRVVGE
jgi:hypothetical protein